MPSSGEKWKQYKKDHPLYMKRQKALDKARHDARMELAKMHAKQFNRIFERIKTERGL
jgi:hypothetical protein